MSESYINLKMLKFCFDNCVIIQLHLCMEVSSTLDMLETVRQFLKSKNLINIS